MPLVLLGSHVLALDDFLNQLDVALIDLGPPIHHPCGRRAHRGSHLGLAQRCQREVRGEGIKLFFLRRMRVMMFLLQGCVGLLLRLALELHQRWRRWDASYPDRRGGVKKQRLVIDNDRGTRFPQVSMWDMWGGRLLGASLVGVVSFISLLSSTIALDRYWSPSCASIPCELMLRWG